MSEQFENMLHSLCFAYSHHVVWNESMKYNEVYAKLVERDRKMLEALKQIATGIWTGEHFIAQEVLKDIGEDV